MPHKIGSKVKYINDQGDEAKGKIHGIQTHESPEGLVTATFYQIDTGEDDRVDVIVTAEGKSNISVRQPQLITISENFIKPL